MQMRDGLPQFAVLKTTRRFAARQSAMDLQFCENENAEMFCDEST
jgi:hypothetical protein